MSLVLCGFLALFYVTDCRPKCKGSSNSLTRSLWLQCQISYRAAFKTCGSCNMQMVSAFKRMGGQCFYNMRRPMPLILAEHIMRAASGSAPLVSKALPRRILKALATHIFQSIRHPHILQAPQPFFVLKVPCTSHRPGGHVNYVVV